MFQLYFLMGFNPFPNKPWFLRVYRTSLLRTLWEKDKLLVRAIYPFPTVFSIRFDNFMTFSSNLKLSSANSFSLEESKICRLGKGKLRPCVCVVWSNGRRLKTRRNVEKSSDQHFLPFQSLIFLLRQNLLYFSYNSTFPTAGPPFHILYSLIYLIVFLVLICGLNFWHPLNSFPITMYSWSSVCAPGVIFVEID